MNNEHDFNWIVAGIIITFLFFVVWLLSGCCNSQPVTETRQDTVYIYQTYTDTLTLAYFDTVWQAGDDRIVLKIDTCWRKVWYKISIRDTVVHTDTLTKYVTVTQEKTWWDEIQIYLFPVLIGIVIVLGLLIYVRK